MRVLSIEVDPSPDSLAHFRRFEAALFSITWEMAILLPIIYAVLIGNDLMLKRVHHARGEGASRRPSAATFGSHAMSEIA